MASFGKDIFFMILFDGTKVACDMLQLCKKGKASTLSKGVLAFIFLLIFTAFINPLLWHYSKSSW